MEVIPLCISEEDIEDIGQEILNRLASCSTRTVLPFIQDYLDSGKGNAKVVPMVKLAYGRKLAENDYLGSADLKLKVEKLAMYDMTTVTFSMPLDKLQELQEDIKSVLNNPYSVPYISPITREGIKGIIEDLTVSGKKEIAERVKRCSMLFKDPVNKSAEGTCLKKIWRNRTEYETMLRGLDIMISRKKSGDSPVTWRFL